MEPGGATVLGLVIVLAVFLAAAYYWYNFTGWSRFAFQGVIPYGVGPACKKDSDCPATAPRCLGSTCKTFCSADPDCPSNLKCARGICETGSLPSWTASGDNNVSDLRFRDCTFTVTDPLDNEHSTEVTSVLNGMAVAYRGASRPPRTLYLDRPLNAFSFVIQGVNDAATVKTAADVQKWANCATSLTGLWRTI